MDSRGRGSTVLASGNTVGDSFNGLVNSGPGLFECAGDNAVRNNTSANSLGMITPPPMM